MAASLSMISGEIQLMWPAGWSPQGTWGKYRSGDVVVIRGIWKPNVSSPDDLLYVQATHSVMSSVSPLGYSCTFQGEHPGEGEGSLPTYWIDKKLNGI